jgi:thioredoxin 2
MRASSCHPAGFGVLLPEEEIKMAAVAEPQLIRCPSCGATNRVPPEKLQQGLEPVCGRCKTALLVPNRPINVTDATFAPEVEGSPLPVLMDMWAAWCAPCRMVAPVVDQIAVELSGRVRVAKMNIDENPATPSRFGVRSIPTLLIFKDGREVDRIVGAQSKQAILSRLHRFL